MKYLIDTCVISELIKKKPNDKVINWINSIGENSLFLCVLTIGEICKGIEKLKDSKKKNKIRTWLDNDLSKRFSNRILFIDYKTAELWGKISGISEQKGKKLPVIDSLIASSAIINNLTLVTRNIQDFKFIDCKTLNPWE